MLHWHRYRPIRVVLQCEHEWPRFAALPAELVERDPYLRFPDGSAPSKPLPKMHTSWTSGRSSCSAHVYEMCRRCDRRRFRTVYQQRPPHTATERFLAFGELPERAE